MICNKKDNLQILSTARPDHYFLCE